MMLRPALALMLLLSLVGTGCKPADPQDVMVKAESKTGFSTWRTWRRDTFTRQQWAEFESALHELKIQIMAGRVATGSEAIEEALRKLVDSQSFAAVLQLGYEAKAHRLEQDRVALESIIGRNDKLTVKPGDTASASVLAKSRDEQTARLAKVTTELNETKAKLNPKIKVRRPAAAAEPEQGPMRVP